MPILISWDNDAHSLIVMRFQDSYSWDELDRAVEQIYAMLNSVPHKVDILSVLETNLKVPGGGNMIARFRAMLNNMPKNLGTYFNVGRGNAFSRAVANTVIKIMPMKFEYHSVGSEDEARRILAERPLHISSQEN